MAEKIFKTILRLDFPMVYRLYDKLGEYLELTHLITSEKPFIKGKGELNTLNHSMHNTSKIGEDIFTLNLDLKTFNTVVEFKDGLNISKLNKSPLFSLCSEFIKKLEDDNVIKYSRIGFRSFIVIERPEYKFDKLRDYIWKANQVFGDTLKDIFGQKNDIAIVFESKSDQDEDIRLTLGPYQQSETSKYFNLENNIKEGLILDVDIWQTKISVPMFNLDKLINRCQKVYSDLIENINLQLNGRL